MKKGLILPLCLASLLMTVAYPAVGQTGSWTPQLERPAQGNYRSPSEKIRILLPSSVPAQTLQRLSLELDTIDITGVVERRGYYLEYTPIQPLAYGTHELRIIDYKPDGSIEEIAFWKLEVRQSALFREASIAAQFNLTASQRVADKNLPQPEADEFQAVGSGIIQTSVIDEGWTLDGAMELMYINDETLSINERQLDLGQFLFTGNSGPLSARVGHHNVTQSNLLMDGFNRRGLSATAAISALNSNATAFALRTNDITGFEQGLGISNSDNRISGLQWDSVLKDTDSSQVLTSAAYLYGRGAQNGIGVVGFDSIVEQINEGDGFNIATDATVFNRQFRIRAELARTTYDFDGLSQGFDAVSDDAHSLLLIYAPTPAQTAGTPTAWSIGAEALRIGTFFKSLGNATLPADKDLQRVFGNLSRGAWSFETSIGQEENNLDNNDTLATTRTDQWYFSGNYSGQQAARGFFSWLGMPSYNFLFSQATLKDIQTPTGAVANNSELKNLSLGGYFNYSRWNWNASYAWSEFIDHADMQIDSETQSLSLNANFAINQRWQLGPQWQLQQTANNDFNTVSENTLYGLASSFVLIDNRLSGNINYMVNEIDAPIDPFSPVAQKTSYATFDLTWNMILPEPNRPGFDLSLSYSSQDINDRLFTLNNNNMYQVFLNLSMTLPVAFPGGAR